MFSKITFVTLLTINYVFGTAIMHDIETTLEPTENPLTFKYRDYYVENILEANFFRAQLYCKYHGMDLASLESANEEKFLREILREKAKGSTDVDSYWISGTKLANKDKWAWLGTGQYLQYFNWNSGEPNNAGNSEYCISMDEGDEDHTGWNDENCDTTHFFICERNAQSFNDM